MRPRARLLRPRPGCILRVLCGFGRRVCVTLAAGLLAGVATAAVPVEEAIEPQREAGTPMATQPRTEALDGAPSAVGSPGGWPPGTPPRRRPSLIDLDGGPTLRGADASGPPGDGEIPVGTGAGLSAFGLAGPDAAPDGTLDPVGELVYQLQLLQEEVQWLRGLVEQQAYQLESLQAEQQARYRDIDRRLQRLGAGLVSPEPGESDGPVARSDGVNADAIGDVGPVDDPDANRRPGRIAPTGGEPLADPERQAYQAAYTLLDTRQFAAAILAFEDFLSRWPDGQLAGNALYWLGELHLVEQPRQLEAARQAFVQVLRRFPEHRKIPDALYKLGVIYHALGEAPQARAYLQQVVSEHPQAPVLRKARSLLADLDGAGGEP